MIYQNTTYGEKEGVTFCQFGKGDIVVSAGENPESKNVCLIMSNSKDGAHPIGDFKEPRAKTTNEMNGLQIVMHFDNVASIDVVIEALQEARQDLIDNGWEKKPAILPDFK